MDIHRGRYTPAGANRQHGPGTPSPAHDPPESFGFNYIRRVIGSKSAHFPQLQIHSDGIPIKIIDSHGISTDAHRLAFGIFPKPTTRRRRIIQPNTYKNT